MIPAKSRPEWAELLTSSVRYDFEFLALKFLMSRLRLKLEVDPEGALPECVDELHAFAEKHERQVEGDLARCFGPEEPR